jgi:hypothetical protein
MLTAIARFIVNLLFNVNGKIKAYLTANPQDTVLFAGAAKGVTYEESSGVERGLKWVAARRGVLLITKQAIIQGNLKISFEDITSADIIEFSSFFTKAFVLRVNTKEGKQHQFGLTYDESLLNQSVLKLTASSEKVKYSLISIIARVVLIIFILNEIYQRFVK